jgi:hypothetical protein
MTMRASPRVVLELFQMRAAPGVNVQSIRCLPAEKEVRDAPHPSIVAVTDWGGPLVDRSGAARMVAMQIAESARELTESIDVGKGSEDLSDSAWGNMIPKLYGTNDPIIISNAFGVLSAKCQQILQAQGTLVRVSAPCKMFGDIHGQVNSLKAATLGCALTSFLRSQFRDLLLLFRMFGFPSHRSGDVEAINYVFNGDWVDRGAHQAR